MAQSYKSLKEDFVSNLSGGGIWEINYVTAVAPAAVLLWSALQSRRGFFVDYGFAAFTTDFLLNVGAILAATTIYSSAPTALNTLLILPAIALYLLPHGSRTRSKKSSPPVVTNGVPEKRQGQASLDPLPERPFITHYRGSMMVVTCVAILAVDFRVFPRRFAKVETWGTSLMDMGVGSFVFAAGLASARPVLKARESGKTASIGASMTAAARHSVPLSILGLVRLYSIKGLDYAEHVSEYGVHWNFFFTLALLPAFAAIIQTLPWSLFSAHFIALSASLVYQVVLDTTSLKAYILTAPRDSLLSQNREGFYSTTDGRTESQRCKEATSRVLGSFNANGLAIFLLANLLTGLVNLSTDTLQAGRARAVVTLLVYSLILAITAITLHLKNIKLKL
ncbi:MAG: hypothetical protein Q9176_004028 [Flavoplaca citrina]